MRWDRLFAELEAQAGDLELDERDQMVQELTDGDWAGTTWRSLLGGEVVLDVLGVGQVVGVPVMVNRDVIQLSGKRADHVINARAVLAVVSSSQRGEEASGVAAALGWGHVFRALRDDGGTLQVRLVDGSSRDGSVEVVGRDFVRLRSESGRGHLVTFDALAVISGRT